MTVNYFLLILIFLLNFFSSQYMVSNIEFIENSAVRFRYLFSQCSKNIKSFWHLAFFTFVSYNYFMFWYLEVTLFFKLYYLCLC
jgi:hypothetical protein